MSDDIRFNGVKFVTSRLEFPGQIPPQGSIPVDIAVELDEPVDPYAPLRTLQRVVVYFDAGTRGGNPGESAIGIYAELDETSDPHFVYKMRISELVGVVTNNQAEWMAFLKVLEIFEHAPALRQLDICSDSKLVVHQARGEWRVRGHLIELFQKSLLIGQRYVDRGCTVTIKHVPRAENKEADRIVTELLDAHTGKKR